MVSPTYEAVMTDRRGLGRAFPVFPRSPKPAGEAGCAGVVCCTARGRCDRIWLDGSIGVGSSPDARASNCQSTSY